MKRITILILFSIVFNCYAQEQVKQEDKEEIKSVINLFFNSLNKKDSLLLKTVAIPHGQVWSISSNANSENFNYRFFRDDIQKLNELPSVKEVALEYDIKVHNNIASAWVPYEFWVNNEFSHCGVDTFTLFRIDGLWKIMTVAYSIEKEGCDVLKEKIKI